MRTTVKKDRWVLTIRSWLGIAAGIAAVAAAAWILSVYIHARMIDPENAARVEALKEEAKTNTEIQEILQPDLEVQYQGLKK
jgi:hypothetical protein